MDFHQLRYFLEVARQEHMGKAARVLAISQSALSHALSALEDDLGVALFDRKGRRIFLNASGRLLLEGGESLLRAKRELEEEIRSQTGEVHGTIRVAAPVSINAHFLGPAFAKIASKNAQVRAEIASLRSLEIAPKVATGEIDFGVCFGPQAHPLLESSRLALRKLILVVRKGTRINNKSSAEIVRTISSMPASLPRGLLGFGHGQTHPFFERHKIEPKVSLLYDNYEVAIAFILANPAWALLPDWIAERHSEWIQPLAREEFFEPLEVTAVWPKNRNLSPIAKLLEAEMKMSLQASSKRQRR